MICRKILVLLVSFLFSLPGDATSPEAEKVQWLTNQWQYFLDKEKELDRGTFLSLSQDSLQLCTERSLNFGATDAALWGRLSYHNQSQWREYLLFAYPLIDTLEIWISNPKQGERAFRVGTHIPFAARPIRDNLFRFPLWPGENKIEFRAVAALNLQIPLAIASEEGVSASLAMLDFYQAVYVGILILAILGSFLIGSISRSRVFFAYAGHLIGTGFITLHLGGYAFMYVWPDHPIINQYEPLIFGLGIFSTLFSMEFLNTRERAPRFHRWLWVSLAFNALVFPLSLLGWNLAANQIVQMVGMLGCFLMLVAGLSLWLKGYRPARFFALAWSVFLIGVIVTILQRVSVLPLNEFTLHASQIGSALDIVLFFAALADKVQYLQAERDEAMKMALQTAQESEQLVKEQNEVLNQKVQERTQELSRKNAQLEKLSAQQNQILSIAGHDLRGPLGSLEQALELMRTDPAMRTEDFLDMLRQSSARAYELLNNILYWARSQKGENEVQLERQDFLPLWKQTHTLFLPSLKQKNLKIREEGMHSPIWIDLDAAMTQTVLRNMLSNALKFSPKGAEIRVKGEQKPGFFAWSIEDEGLGIEPLVLNQMREGKPVRSQTGTTGEQGTGLGLSLSFAMMQAMRGELHITSKVGQGSTFTLLFPTDVGER